MVKFKSNAKFCQTAKKRISDIFKLYIISMKPEAKNRFGHFNLWR